MRHGPPRRQHAPVVNLPSQAIALGRADKGLIIATGSFTVDARRAATRDGAPAIDLVDGELLCQLLKERGFDVIVREVRTEEVTVDSHSLPSV